MGDANDLFMLRPVKVTVRRDYSGQEWAEVSLMVPNYASDDTIKEIVKDYLYSPQGEETEFSDRGSGYGGVAGYAIESIEDAE